MDCCEDCCGGRSSTGSLDAGGPIENMPGGVACDSAILDATPAAVRSSTLCGACGKASLAFETAAVDAEEFVEACEAEEGGCLLE